MTTPRKYFSNFFFFLINKNVSKIKSVTFLTKTKALTKQLKMISEVKYSLQNQIKKKKKNRC